MMLSNCDIGSRIEESMKDFPHFDFSLIKENKNYLNLKIWNLYDISNKEVFNNIMKYILDEKCAGNKEEFNSKAHIYLNEYMKNLFPKYIEAQVETN